jgi:hypothetical protein
MRIVTILLLLSASMTGCITSAGGQLPAITPAPPGKLAAIEQTVGDFTFTLEGGKMVTSNAAGRVLNKEILTRWEKKKYIESHSYVESGRFSGSADYNLTLSGSQYGDSSIAMQILSGLTLMLIPYTVDTRYDVQYTLERTSTGQRFSYGVAENYDTFVELFLLFVPPLWTRGANETYDNIADHLYEGLRRQGAFAD